MQQALTFLIPLLTMVVLAAWHSGAIQRVVNKGALRLPQWAQPIPPILLSSLATVVVALVQGVAPTAEDTGTAGLLTVGLYHVAKRWVPTFLISDVKKASLAGVVFLAFGCATAKPPANANDVLVLAEGVVAITDAALAVAINALPEGTDMAPWTQRVEALEKIAEPLRTGKATLDDVCRELPSIAALGAVVSCDKCTEAATTVHALVCGGSK